MPTLMRKAEASAAATQGRSEAVCRPEAEGRESLAARVSEAFARSVRDNILAEFGAQAIRFGGIIFLARILGPEDFGILKALVAVTLIATIFIQAGIPDALIQRRELTGEHECAGWWMSLAVTSIVVATVYLGAAHIAGWMEMPGLKPAIRLMCVPIFIEGTSMVSNARLERALSFGALALADVLAEIAFVAVALALLVAGLPRWSLIGGLAARFAIHGLTVWSASPRIYLALPRPHAIRDLFGFALSVWGGRIVQALSDNSDYLLIGRLLGSGPLGIYGMARDLLRFVPNRLHRVAGRVIFSAFCKLQDDSREMARAYAQFYCAMTRIILPLLMCMAVTAPDLVKTMYGARWLAAAAPLQALALGLAFAGLKTAVSSIYTAKGHPSLDIHLNGLRLVLVVAILLVLRNRGLLAIAVGISAAEIMTSIAAQYVGSCFTSLTLADILRESLPGVRLALVCGATSLFVSIVCHHFGIHGVPALALALLAAGAVYLRLEAANLTYMVKRAYSSPPQAPVQEEHDSDAEVAAF